jgi:hypothetical protein
MSYKAKYSRKEFAVHKGPLKCRSTHIVLSRKQILFKNLVEHELVMYSI